MRKRLPTINASAAENYEPIFAEAEDVKIVAADSEGKKGPPRFDVTVYTGGKLNVNKYELPVVIDLKGLSTRRRVNANLDHDKKQRVGQVTKRLNDGKSLRLEGLANAASAARDEVVGSAADGFDWGASIEAKPLKLVKVPEGKKAEVNGQVQDGPFLIARKSELQGFAFLTGEADQNSSVTIAAAAATQPGDLSMDFTKWIEAAGFTNDEYEELTDKQKAGMKAKYDAEIKAAKKDPPTKIAAGEPVELDVPEFDVEDIRAGYADHMERIEAKACEYEENITDTKKLATIKAAAKKKARELKAQAVKEKWSSAKFETASINASAEFEIELVRAERPTGPAIHASMRDVSGPVIEAALCQSLNMDRKALEDQYEDKVLEAAHKTFHGRIGLQQILIMAASANGYQHVPGERINQANLRRILKFAFMGDADIQASSSLSLSNVFSNVATKELIAGFQEEDQTWREIAVIKPVNDFKQMTSFRLNDNFEYEELTAEGRMARGQLGEESYTRQAKTYAKFWSLTRVDILNDDQGAFNDLRSRLGRGAGRKFNNLFWSRFMSALSTLFTAARGNYITGSTTTLLADGVGLQLAITALDQLKDASGKRIGGSASLLLVPPELQFSADRLYQSTNVNTGGAATAETVGNANIHANKYRPVKQVRLSDSTFTGYSTTGWCLLRAASELAAMVVSFLNGVQTPTVESADAAFDTLGIDFRGFHDFGADAAEYLCGVRSKGAA